jgi:hypothetical protein
MTLKTPRPSQAECAAWNREAELWSPTGAARPRSAKRASVAPVETSEPRHLAPASHAHPYDEVAEGVESCLFAASRLWEQGKVDDQHSAFLWQAALEVRKVGDSARKRELLESVVRKCLRTVHHHSLTPSSQSCFELLGWIAERCNPEVAEALIRLRDNAVNGFMSQPRMAITVCTDGEFSMLLTLARDVDAGEAGPLTPPPDAA